MWKNERCSRPHCSATQLSSGVGNYYYDDDDGVMGMMSVLLADANERISAGSPRIGTGVNVLAKTSTPFFSP